jgi:zinc transport system substrate-binding protein
MTVMNVRRLIPTAAVASAATLGLLALTGCSGADSVSTGGGTSGGKLAVVTSFYPLQFLAERIGGTHVSVTDLTKPGVEPHDLEITPRQTAQLEESDAVVYLKGLQPAVDKTVAQSSVKTKIDAAALTKLEDHGSEVGHADGDEEAAEAAEELSADPHIWLDPVKFAEVANGVGAAFEKADAAHAADYKANTAKLVAELDTLNTEFKTGLTTVTTRTFITTHSAFGYLAERYGLVQEGIAGIDPESEPSPARMKELQKIAKEDGVTTVFFETLASDRTARTVAADTGLATDVLDPLEGITDKSKGDDYFAVMRSNLTALQKALGAKQ